MSEHQNFLFCFGSDLCRTETLKGPTHQKNMSENQNFYFVLVPIFSLKKCHRENKKIQGEIGTTKKNYSSHRVTSSTGGRIEGESISWG